MKKEFILNFQYIKYIQFLTFIIKLNHMIY
jgi:hypothetical protein